MRVHRHLSRSAGALVQSPIVLGVGAAMAGLVVAYLIGLGDLADASWYAAMTAVLLAIGLYGSTYGIEIDKIRRDAGTVIVAVTVGVFVKAALIAGLMVAIFHNPEYLVLGIVVAQIDPLSVAAMQGSSRMSRRAKTLLAAWASFDDPMTVLLAIYFAVFAFHAAGRTGTLNSGPATDGLLGFASDVGRNLAFVVATFLIWKAVVFLRARSRRRLRASSDVAASGRRWQWIICGLLIILVAVAAREFLMLGLAITGLYFRASIDRVINRVVRAAFLCAAFALGLLLLQGVDLFAGLLLGVLAFGAQVLVGLIIPAKLEWTDRIYLALGQQNGITAIILALALQPDFDKTVAIVAPAILTINLLHFAGNALWNRRLPALRPEIPGAAPETPLGVAPPAPTRQEPALQQPTGPDPSRQPPPATKRPADGSPGRPALPGVVNRGMALPHRGIPQPAPRPSGRTAAEWHPHSRKQADESGFGP